MPRKEGGREKGRGREGERQRDVRTDRDRHGQTLHLG